MTTPDVRSNLYTDFYNSPGVDKSGAVRMIPINTTVTSAESAGTVYELFPFNKGCRVIALNVDIPDISDGSSTADLGYVYDDNTTYTNDPDAFIDGTTATQTSSLVDRV